MSTDIAQFGDKNAAAVLFGVSPRTIEAWTQRREIPFVRISHRCVRYDLAALTEWARERTVPVGGDLAADVRPQMAGPVPRGESRSRSAGTSRERTVPVGGARS